jgi:hypothetical protein
MKINQNLKDGSAEIIFSDNEIDIINKKKKLFFTPEGLRHISNTLIKVVVDINSNFPEEIKKVITVENSKVEGN